MNTLRCDNDDLKNATATGFGKLCMGNLELFFPELLCLIEQDDELQYLLLQSLKEVGGRESLIKEGENVSFQILTQLVRASGNEQVIQRICPELL